MMVRVLATRKEKTHFNGKEKIVKSRKREGKAAAKMAP